MALERSLLDLARPGQILVKAHRGRLDKHTPISGRNSVWVVPLSMSTSKERTKLTPHPQADQKMKCKGVLTGTLCLQINVSPSRWCALYTAGELALLICASLQSCLLS